MLNFKGVVKDLEKNHSKKNIWRFRPGKRQGILGSDEGGPSGIEDPPQNGLRNASIILPLPKRTASLHLKMDGLGVGRLL